MDEQTPGNPFRSDTFEYAPASIDSPLQGEPLFRLGDHYLVYQVRRGGMGEVFLCKHTLMEKAPPLALKSFQKRFFYDSAIRSAFIRETRHWSQLSGLPHIMPVFGLDYFDNRPFIQMMGIDPSSSGVISVRDMLKQHLGPLPTHLTFSYAYQTAVGMYTAQQRVTNLIHGDLKPENLLLLNEKALYISDFGLARIVTGSTQGEHPLESTWAYRAPESWKSSGMISQATDIYAFGVILYELLTGELPFHAQTREEWSQAHQTLQPSPPLGFPQNGAAADGMDLALRCLAKESADRPQGFESIQCELEHLNSHYFSDMQKDLEMSQTLLYFALYSKFKVFAIQTLIASEQYEEALTELEQIPRETFDKPLWHMLSNTLSLLERDAEALSAFEQALQTAPEDPELLSDYALSLKRLKRFQEAIDIYEELLTRIADEKLYMRTATNLATVYLESDQPEKAASLLLGLARSYPKASSVWANLGEAYRMLGRYADAVKFYQQALSYAPYDTNIQMLLGSVLMDNLGRVNEALIVLELVAAQQEKQSYAWLVRFLACNVVLENEEYVAPYYYELTGLGWAQAKVAELQDDVRRLVELVRNVQSAIGAPELPSSKDETMAPSTKSIESSEKSCFTDIALQGDQEPDPVDSRMRQEAPENAETQRSSTTLSDGRYGADLISLPFLNVRFYMINAGREYSIDFYDDVNTPEYVDHFLTEWRRATRNYVPMVDSNFTLRPNLFYFTICPNCDIAILTNRDQGKEMRCRRCDTLHTTTENKRYDLTALLSRIQGELGRSPLSMTGLMQVLLIQPMENSDLSIVEEICTQAGFTQMPKEARAAGHLWNVGHQRGMLSINLPFSVWQKLAEGGERAGNEGTPPEIDVVLQKLRSVTRIRSLCMLLDPRENSIHSLLLQGKLDQVEVVLQEQVLAGEDISDSLASLASILISQGRYSEAHEKIMVLLQFRPDEEDGWSLLGELEMEREQYQDAIAPLEKARSIDPVNWRTLASLAFCYHKLGDVGKAESYAALARSLGAVSLQI